jgi:hypothetical protein
MGDFKAASSLETSIQNATFEDSVIRIKLRNIAGFSKTSDPLAITVIRYIPPPDIPGFEIILVVCVIFLMIISVVLFLRR